MVAIIGELPAIGKTQRNAQQNFMFRGHDDVMNALNPLLAKHGVFIVPDVLERVTAERQTSQNKTMYEVNLHVRFTFYGAAGDSFIATGWGEGTDMGDKATNKAMTMAFKYVIAQSFALATAETSDADADTPEETTRRNGAPLDNLTPIPEDAKPSEYVIHFGKNRGVLLGSLTEAQLKWYAERWQVQAEPSDYDLRLKAAAVALASGDDSPMNGVPADMADVPFE
jgi:hypothetical protein